MVKPLPVVLGKVKIRLFDQAMCAPNIMGKGDDSMALQPGVADLVIFLKKHV
jgi:hypothetical protein